VIFIAAPNYEMAIRWCHEHHVNPREARVLTANMASLAYLRGYRQAEVHWINAGPPRLNMRNELLAWERQGLIRITWESM